MGKVNIDKYFKKRVSDYSADIDTNALWKDLDIEVKKKDRGFFFWLFGLIPLLALVAIVYFSFFTFENEPVPSKAEQSPVAPINSPIEKKEVTETLPGSTVETFSPEMTITKSKLISKKPKSRKENEVLP